MGVGELCQSRFVPFVRVLAALQIFRLCFVQKSCLFFELKCILHTYAIVVSYSIFILFSFILSNFIRVLVG